MSNLATLTIADARDMLRAGDTTSRQITEDCLAAVEQSGPLNAFIGVTADKALAMAEAADQRRANGDDTDLLGIPLGIKDLYCTAGVRTQAASKILDGFTPAYESSVTSQLWEAGAVMLGKLNMDEFAMGSSNENSVYGPCVSPWRRDGDTAPITPGGSSGGSAAAVAADLCLGSIGTDTASDFLLLIERPDLRDDEVLAQVPGRMARFEEWNEIVHAYTTQHTSAEIVGPRGSTEDPSRT